MPLAPRYTWGRNRWPAYFWRGVVIAILVLLVAADLSPRPVLFTSELSFEVVSQMEEAGEVCRGDRDSKGSSCAVEVWKACHMAKLELDDSHEMPTGGMARAAGKLCDAAVIADAGELASALASRYGDKYFRKGFYKITETGRVLSSSLVFRGGQGWITQSIELNDTSNRSFLAFQDLLDIEFYTLYNISFTISGQRHPDWPKLYYQAHKLSTIVGSMSDDTVVKLRALLSNISDFFEPYRNYGSYQLPSLEDYWEVNANPWKESSSFVNIQGIVERNCSVARIAARERGLSWDKLLHRCLHLADICEMRSDGFTASCSLAKGAAEFENLWQKLPKICVMTYERVEETIGDACYQAALDICEYKLVSPEDEWLDQLISMREFACTAASRTPDLRFVQMARG